MTKTWWDADAAGKPVCFVCRANVVVVKQYNIRRHRVTKHQDECTKYTAIVTGDRRVIWSYNTLKWSCSEGFTGRRDIEVGSAATSRALTFSNVCLSSRTPSLLLMVCVSVPLKSTVDGKASSHTPLLWIRARTDASQLVIFIHFMC